MSKPLVNVAVLGGEGPEFEPQTRRLMEAIRGRGAELQCRASAPAASPADTDRLSEPVPFQVRIESRHRLYTLIDYAHPDFPAPLLLLAARCIDAVLLVVSSREGVCVQTREHALAARYAGARHAVVVLDVSRGLPRGCNLEQRELEVRMMLAEYGFPADDVPIVCSAIDQAKRYPDEDEACGPIDELISTLDRAVPAPVRDVDGPVMLAVEDTVRWPEVPGGVGVPLESAERAEEVGTVFYTGSVEDYFRSGFHPPTLQPAPAGPTYRPEDMFYAGWVLRGTLRVGAELTMNGAPNWRLLRVVELRSFGAPVEVATAGQRVYYRVTSGTEAERGAVALDTGEVLAERGTVERARRFEADCYFPRPEEGGCEQVLAYPAVVHHMSLWIRIHGEETVAGFEFPVNMPPALPGDTLRLTIDVGYRPTTVGMPFTFRGDKGLVGYGVVTRILG